MRELKIFAVVAFFTGVLYWGVEPFAHTQLHPHLEPADYTFNDVDGLNGITGDATKGAEIVAMNCTACHSIKSAGFPQLMDDASAAAAYGVTPPDLSTAGKIYDANFLAAFIKDPAKATKTTHAFVDGKVHPMPGYSWMQPQEIADIVAYLVSIAPQEMTNKEVFQDACQRCHSIKYGDFYGGSMAAKTPDANIKTYMGKMPPDLSQYIRSRGEHYLHTFINDPQKHLQGTAMPRVGLTHESEKQIIEYMTEVGDSSKPKREALAGPFLGYLVIFAIFAWLWKAKIWREVH
ncbi:MAG: c-type cytochrome [Campylobacterota bacterium]|nr:c-type cytochrome [Campylobacterota bacterium]